MWLGFEMLGFRDLEIDSKIKGGMPFADTWLFGIYFVNFGPNKLKTPT